MCQIDPSTFCPLFPTFFAIKFAQDERQRLPAEPGHVDAQEAAGGPGEGRQCNQILARWHIRVPCFFQT